MLNESMTARFNDSDIVKIVVHPNDPEHVILETLDSNGDVVPLDTYLTYPLVKIKVINTNTSAFYYLLGLGHVIECGVEMETVHIPPNGGTLNVETIFITPDGLNYVWPIQTDGSYVVSDAVNCMEYSGNIVATDIDAAEISCTITLS